MINLSKEKYIVQPGDRIAQGVINKVERAEFKEVREFRKKLSLNSLISLNSLPQTQNIYPSFPIFALSTSGDNTTHYAKMSGIDLIQKSFQRTTLCLQVLLSTALTIR